MLNIRYSSISDISQMLKRQNQSTQTLSAPCDAEIQTCLDTVDAEVQTIVDTKNVACDGNPIVFSAFQAIKKLSTIAETNHNEPNEKTKKTKRKCWFTRFFLKK